MRFWVVFVGLVCFSNASNAWAGEKSARELYDQINAIRVDGSSTYEIEPAQRIELRRADVQFFFERGKIAFLQAFDGHSTGVVFLGFGHVLASPRQPVEKQQMARFLGAPMLDEDFTSACLRFTDDTTSELRHQLERANLSPHQDSTFAASWDPLLAMLNPSQSLRVLFDVLSRNPKPFFFAAVDAVTSGRFDVLLDPLRSEPLLLAQLKKLANGTFYDVWASYKLPDIPMPQVPFHALRYAIDTSILPNNSLEARTEVRFRAESGGERMMALQLSRLLTIEEVTGEHGEPLIFFQNEGISLRERGTRGNDYLYVVLPSAPAGGSEFAVRFRYRGSVIEDSGNGVLYVGSRQSWYPHLGDAADFADYDLTMRWPRRLHLVATGTKLDEHEDGEVRVGHWRAEKPLSVAGFNLGEYALASVSSQAYSVDVYANRALEQALGNRLNSPTFDTPRFPGLYGPEGQNPSRMSPILVAPPSPADALKQLARDIDSSIHFYEGFSGPFPFQKLGVSQIPGTFGQGWPGLLYLSTLSFLPPSAQQRAGLSENAQEQFTALVPFHEVAHQWWGNIVGWSSYRDQWIDEAIANYLALLFAENQKNANHSLRVWLTRYRQRLTEKPAIGSEAAVEIGPLDLGSRLSSSKSPDGFERIIYPKGSWVIHMLREMLRRAGTKNPDANFIALLHTLATKYAYRALSTNDLQHEIEAVMTPAMDLEGGRSMEWFFEQWVRGTAIPHYRVEFSVHHTEKGLNVRGKLFQSEVPHSFIAPVPLYANFGSGQLSLLGVINAEGPETSFHFNVPSAPRKVIIDPRMTLLCVTQ